MKDYEVMVWVILEIMELIMLFWVGKYTHKYVYFTYICLYFIVHSSPYLCVCVAMIGYLVIREQMM